MPAKEPSQSEMSSTEWEARVELAACYRIFAMKGWTESIYNHITVKVPGEDGAFLINPFGLMYEEVCASNLIKIDIDGNKLSDSPWEVNKAGFVQHSTLHRHLPEAHAIIHTHTTATMAVCALEGGLQPTNFYACNFAGRIGYHDFEGITIRSEEGERILSNLAHHQILMLRNHGPVVIGQTLPDAFLNYWTLQRACEIQLATQSAGKPILVSDDVVAVHQRDYQKAIEGFVVGQADFAAHVRMLDRISRDWRN